MTAPIGDGYGSIGSCGQSVAIASTNVTQTLDPISRAIYIATDGSLQYQLAWDTASDTITVKAGSWLPLRVKIVYACPAGTKAYW